MMMLIHDISIPIHPAMVVWPGQPAVETRYLSQLSEGDRSTVTHLSLSAHTGTHMDAPRHFVPGQEGIDELDLNTLVGPAVVVDAPDANELSAEAFDALDIPDGTERLLVRTSNSQLWDDPAHDAFYEDYVAVTQSGAQWLVDHDVKLIGVDYLSVAPYNDLVVPHQILLGAKVVIVEGLNLAKTIPGLYELVCLPLKLAGSDGSPARAILIERGQ
jgi:arylformamidase